MCCPFQTCCDSTTSKIVVAPPLAVFQKPNLVEVGGNGTHFCTLQDGCHANFYTDRTFLWLAANLDHLHIGDCISELHPELLQRAQFAVRRRRQCVGIFQLALAAGLPVLCRFFLHHALGRRLQGGATRKNGQGAPLQGSGKEATWFVVGWVHGLQG